MRESSAAKKLAVRPKIERTLPLLALPKPKPRFSSWAPFDLQDLSLEVPGGDEHATIEWINNTRGTNAKHRSATRSLMLDGVEHGGVEQIGSYEIIRHLGKQDGVDFYLGDRPSSFGTSIRAVIKHVSSDHPHFSSERERLLEEAFISERFNHPNLVPLQNAGEDDTGCYLVIEDVVGTNLARAQALLHERSQGFPLELISWMVGEVLRGLNFAHGLKDKRGRPLGLVLRDIVPANVLVADTGQVRLATFALQIVPRSCSESRPLPGAAAYIAPERIARAHCDKTADIYAAGMLMFELLAGQTALTQMAPPQILAKLMHEGLPLNVLREEGVPEGLIDIVERATARDPRDRYESAASMADALDEWMLDTERHATPSMVGHFFKSEQLFGEREAGSGSARLRAIEVAEREVVQGAPAHTFEKTVEETIEDNVERAVNETKEEISAEYGLQDMVMDTIPQGHFDSRTEDALSAMIIKEEVELSGARVPRLASLASKTEEFFDDDSDEFVETQDAAPLIEAGLISPFDIQDKTVPDRPKDPVVTARPVVKDPQRSVRGLPMSLSQTVDSELSGLSDASYVSDLSVTPWTEANQDQRSADDIKPPSVVAAPAQKNQGTEKVSALLTPAGLQKSSVARRPLISDVVQISQGPSIPARIAVSALTLILAVVVLGLLISSGDEALVGAVIATGPAHSEMKVSATTDAVFEKLSMVQVGPKAEGPQGQLRLSTQPAVRVFWGRVLLGKTPLKLGVPVGGHELKFVDKESGLQMTKRYAVSADEVVADHQVFAKSELVIDAPKGAKVYLGTKYLGEAPLDPVSLFEGTHALKVEADGQSLSDLIELPAQKRVEYKIELR